MKKRVAVLMVLLSVIMTMFAFPVAAVEQSAWSEAYREFVLDEGFRSSDENYYDAYDYAYVQFAMFDLSRDGVPELISCSGTGKEKHIYMYDNGRIRHLGNLIYERPCRYLLDSGYTGLFNFGGDTGMYSCDYITMENGAYREEPVYSVFYRLNEAERNQTTSDKELCDTAVSVCEEGAGEALPFYSLAEIRAMGWDRFAGIFSDILEPESGAYTVSVERVDQTASRTENGKTAQVSVYYDLVQLKPENNSAAQEINAALKNDMEQYFSEVESQSSGWLNSLSSEECLQLAEDQEKWGVSVYEQAEVWSCFLSKDVLSVCIKHTHNARTGMTVDYRCLTLDVPTGKSVDLPGFLGISDDETKSLVIDAVSGENVSFDLSAWKQAQSSADASDYQFCIDRWSNLIYLYFDKDELGDTLGFGREVLLAYTPRPKIVTLPAESVKSDEDTMELSVHCYGTDLSYDWEYSDDGTQWVPADCSEPVLTIEKAEAVERRLYRCTVTNDAGSVTSDPIEIPAELLASSGAPLPQDEGAGLDEKMVLWIGVVAALIILLLALFLFLRKRRKTSRKSEKIAPAPKTDEIPRIQPMSGPKFCGRCGTPRKGDEAFCTNCGHPLIKK